MPSRKKHNRHRRDLNEAGSNNVEECKSTTDLDGTSGNISDLSSAAEPRDKKKKQKKKKKIHSRQLPAVRLEVVDEFKTNDTLEDMPSKRKHREKGKRRHRHRDDRLENMNEVKEMTNMNDIGKHGLNVPSTNQSTRKQDKHSHKKSEKYAEVTKPDTWSSSSVQKTGNGILKKLSLTTVAPRSILANSFGSKRASSSMADTESKPVDQQQEATAAPSIPSPPFKISDKKSSGFVRNLQMEKLTEQYIKEMEKNDIGAVVVQIVSYAIYFLIFCVITYGRLYQSTPSDFREALAHRFLPPLPIYNDNKEFLAPAFNEISHVEDLWSYIEHRFVPALAAKSLKIDTKVESDQEIFFPGSELLGKVHISQKRAKRVTCNDILLEEAHTCSSSSESSVDPYGGPNNDMFKWLPDPHAEINSLIFRPRSSYGDGSFGIFLSTPFNINESISAIHQLKDNQWIDKHTRAVTLQFTVFNSNINLFAVVSIWIEVELTGGILPEHFIRVDDFFLYDSTADRALAFFECIFVIMSLGFGIQHVRMIRKAGKKYFSQFWNMIELSNHFCILIIICSRIVLAVVSEKLLRLQHELGPSEYIDWLPLAYSSSALRGFSGYNAIFMWIQLLKYTRISPRMVMLELVLKHARSYMGAFIVIFFVVFNAHVSAFYMLFSESMTEFSSTQSSFISLFRSTLGNFSYATMEDQHSMLGPIVLVVFICFIFLLLLNLLLAIMRDAYSKTRECLNEERQTREKISNQAFDQFRRVAIKSISKFLMKNRIVPAPPNTSVQKEDTTGELSETCGSVRVPISPADEGKPHVLIVDDDEINLKLLSLMVTRENCQVTTARSGTLAVEIFRELGHFIDCILMDLMMPDINGIEATQMIREIELEHCERYDAPKQQVPIIALTGLEKKDVIEMAKSVGICLILSKPILRSDLRKVLGAVLKKPEVST